MDFLGQVKVPVKNVTFRGFRGYRGVSELTFLGVRLGPIGADWGDCKSGVFFNVL